VSGLREVLLGGLGFVFSFSCFGHSEALSILEVVKKGFVRATMQQRGEVG
jgi:hypothetical protein